MASTSRKSTLKNSTKLPSMNGDTPKKVRFSAAGGTSKKFTAEDVLSMLNDSSLSEAENSSSEEEWIVTKAKNSTPVELIQKSESSQKISRKENEVVSPLKLLRKPEYEVNKATNKHKKSESAVSPIVIKRRTEAKKIRTEASEAVSSDPLIQSSKSNDLANHDGGDTENDITSTNKSTPSKVRKTTQSIATPNSATKKERKQFELESSDEFDEKISKLRIADTPVKQQSKVTKTTQSIATPNSATKKERKQFELESSDEFDETIGKLRIADTPVKQVSRNIADDVSLFKRLKGTPERGKSQKSSRSIDDVPLSKKLAETPEKGKSQMVPFNGRSETENTPQSERRSSKRIPVKKKIFDPDEEMECAVSPPKRRSVRASNVDSPRLSRKSATQNITVISDSDFEMEESKTPKKRKSVRKPVAISESDFEMEESKTVIKRKSVRKSVAITHSDFETEESKTLNQRKSVRKSVVFSDSEMEESKSPMKRKSVRKTVARSYKEKDNSDIEISSPEVKRTPRRSTMVARSYKEKDNSDIEISSPELKRTPRRSTMKPRESFVDSPDLRKQLLTPRFSARKKLDLSSPSSVKKVGSGFLSPVVNERARRSILGTPTSQIAEARASLHTGNIPTSLPCREKEFENILNFLSRKIEDKAGGCMYISGVPGTGKTATVHAVVRTLQEQVITGDMPKFDFIEINALRLTEPRQAYTRIWNELSGEKISADSAMKALEKKYTHKNKRPSVVLVDELDYLCNRRQDVIYNILEWSTKSTAALTVISIANTMDLPERTLKGKVTSRMGLTRLVFQPYTFQQLQMIVMNRLGENLSFHVDAVQLVARKVAAVSGDARRALDICRRVTELVSSDTEIIKVTHVEKAISQIFSGTRVRAIKGCSIMCQYLLRAMRDEFQRTGVEESTVGQVYSQFTTICAFEGCEPAQIGVVLSLCTILSDSGLILAEKSRTDLYRKIALNVSADDIFYACNA